MKYVNEAYETNWVAPLGENVDGFERDIRTFTNSGHCAVLSSGTAALHLALILADVKPGDYVICQSMTFSASANPIVYLGAVPVFVDSEPETWNISPEFLEEAIGFCLSQGKKPKAIIATSEHAHIVIILAKILARVKTKVILRVGIPYSILFKKYDNLKYKDVDDPEREKAFNEMQSIRKQSIELTREIVKSNEKFHRLHDSVHGHIPKFKR